MGVVKAEEVCKESMNNIGREIAVMDGVYVNIQCGFYVTNDCVHIGNCPEDYFKCEWHSQ